jgi:hypothetical protein
MRKISLSQWAAELEHQIAEIPVATEAALATIGSAVAEIARHKIGEYQGAVAGAGWAFPEWPLLAARTVADKTAKGFAPPDNPLLRTGEMRSTVSFFVAGDMLVVGSTDPVARYQEIGTDRIPPRPFIGPAMLEADLLIKRELGGALASVLRGGRY